MSTFHNTTEEFNEVSVEDIDLYPTCYIIGGGGIARFHAIVSKGGALFATISGIVTKIKNMPTNGKLKSIGVADKQDDIWSRIYYLASKFLGIKVGDKVKSDECYRKI